MSTVIGFPSSGAGVSVGVSVGAADSTDVFVGIQVSDGVAVSAVVEPPAVGEQSSRTRFNGG